MKLSFLVIVNSTINTEPQIETNESLLNSKITYAVSCEAAGDLGKKIVEKGGKAFIGYEGPFGFVHDANRECTPSKDKLAEPFKNVSNTIVISLPLSI